MDVLVGHRFYFVGRILAENTLQATINCLPLLGTEDSCAEKALRMCPTGTHIDLEKDSIDRKRSIHLFEDGVLILFKSSLPEFHIFRDRAGIARMQAVQEY